jgi:hypothetical protein
MRDKLEYMQVYDLGNSVLDCPKVLGGDTGGWKGVYLGQYNFQSKSKFQHLMLLHKRITKNPINKDAPYSDSSLLLRFPTYSFNLEGELILKDEISVNIPSFQKDFYKRVLEEKLINPSPKTFINPNL